MANFDVEAARAQFPALQQVDQVFLDNAGGSQTLGTVIESIRDYLTKTNVQLGASYATGKLSTQRYNAGLEAGAKFLNAQTDEIAYGSSTTQLLRNLSYTFAFSPGDEIVVSSIDHEANIAPWVDLASRQSLVLKWWTPPPPREDHGVVDPRLQPSQLAALLSPRTRLVTCTHASNILGTITDISGIRSAIRAGPSPTALLLVDGVAYAGHRRVDVAALGVDYYVLSWYKVYGPHVAMLYGSRGAQEQMRSLGHEFNPHRTLGDKIALGSTSYELIQSIPSIISYLTTTSPWSSIASHESALQSTLLSYLASKPGTYTVYGSRSADPRVRLPTVSFAAAGWDDARDLVEAVEAADPGLGFRWGAFYSERLVREYLGLGPGGVARVSLVHYNTVEEVNRFIEVLDRVVNSKKA
ncbi:hypothetical protein AAE478_000215 [Parahypoxylon ruwenzoriense]